MIRMTVAEMLAATCAELLTGSRDAVFEGVVIDSRQAGAGNAFVAFSGERVDGNEYVAQALRAGAGVAVVTREADDDALAAARETGGCIVRARDDDAEAFMLALAGAWRRDNPQWTVVGVTGSVGKTTTKDMLAAAIGASRRVHATKGNFNNLLGVPLTLFAAEPTDEVLVVEMGMNHAGELARISECARPDVAVITNVGTSHIGNLGSREGIARAKAEVVGGMRHGGPVGPTLVMHADDDFTDFIESEFCRSSSVSVLRVGGRDGALTARDVRLDENGLASISIVFQDGASLSGELSLPGQAMVEDALSAMGVSEILGLPREASLLAIGSMKPTSLRVEVAQTERSARIINDAYNASPSSMAAALDLLCSMACSGRRIAVLGEIGELGDMSDRLHVMVGAYAAAKSLDMLCVVGGEAADSLVDGARTMGFSEDRLSRFATAAEAARVLVPVLEPDDLVLVKASRSVGLELFAKEALSV